MSNQSPIQDTINNPSTTRDNDVYLKAGLRRGSTTYWIPAQNIIEIGFIEDMHELLWEGVLQFGDPGGAMGKKFGFTGEEDVILGFGGDEDNRWDGQATVHSVAGWEYDSQGAIATLKLGHPSHEEAEYADSSVYFGLISDIFNDIMKKMCIEDVKLVKTLNTGQYVNPGLKLGEFTNYLKRLAISTDGVSSYQAFATKSKFHFQPRDYFNRESVNEKIHSFSERPSYTNYRQNILGTKITPINGQFESAGITQRKAVGFNYDTGKAIKEDFNVDDLISKKTFTGRYIPLKKEHPKAPRMVEYTGLRAEDDVKGYVTGRAERNMERISMVTLDVPGQISLEPGVPVRLGFESDDPNNPEERYHSGKYIIERAVHMASPETGYNTRIHCVRNGIPEVADELQLKKAKTVKET